MSVGRPPAKSPEVTSVALLSDDDLASFRPATPPALKNLRDSHHAMARLFAMGLRTGEVAETIGYSVTRVSLLRNDPAFSELVEQYRKQVSEQWGDAVDEYYRTVAANRNIAARLINDKLGTIEPDDISFRELIAVHADSADRTGYPKRTVAVNVNVDFAARLDQAIERSNKAKLVSGLAVSAPSDDGGARETCPSEAAPVIIDHLPQRRRA